MVGAIECFIRANYSKRRNISSIEMIARVYFTSRAALFRMFKVAAPLPLSVVSIKSVELSQSSVKKTRLAILSFKVTSPALSAILRDWRTQKLSIP